MSFKVKSLKQITDDMLVSVQASSVAPKKVTDTSPGSVVRTIIEAVALLIADIYLQVAKLRELFSIDLANGSDLDARAQDYGVTRIAASKATGYVAVSDSSYTTKAASTLNGAVSIGATTARIQAANFDSFPDEGWVIFERDTDGKRERVQYETKTVPDILTLVTPITIAHASGTSVIVSRLGTDRTVAAGTVIKRIATSTTPAISVETTASVVLLDGEAAVLAPVAAQIAGTISVVAVGGLSTFDTLPWATALVRNNSALSGGYNRESDQDFKQRIKDQVQSLTRATTTALRSAVTSTVVGQVKITDVEIVENSYSRDLTVYIGDGTSEPVGSPTARNTDDIVIFNADSGQKLGRLALRPTYDAPKIFKSDYEVNVTSVLDNGDGTATVGFSDAGRSASAGNTFYDSSRISFTVTASTTTSITVSFTTVLPNTGWGCVFSYDAADMLVRAYEDVPMSVTVGRATSVTDGGTTATITDTSAARITNSLQYKYMYCDRNGGAYAIIGNGYQTITVNKSGLSTPTVNSDYALVPYTDIVSRSLNRNDFWFNETTGDIELVQGLRAHQALIAHPVASVAYYYYGSHHPISVVQKVLNGDLANTTEYPGVKAAGVKARVVWATVRDVYVTVNITTSGVSESSVYDSVKSAVVNYINSRRLGEDVFLSGIVAAAHSVGGVESATVTSPTSDIVMLSGQTARSDVSKITVV